MKDPYEVLGVGRGASDDEIKKAYRDLTRKYHPDNYVGHDLADLAEEKMKEINAAYEAIQKEREGGYSGAQQQRGWGGGAAYTGGSPRYTPIRENIQRGYVDQAQSQLDQISDRDAEWHYLYGLVMHRRGWYDEARNQINQAVAMDPGNQEYRQAQMQMSRTRGSYSPMGQQAQCSMCDICSAMICADCLCDAVRCC